VLFVLGVRGRGDLHPDGSPMWLRQSRCSSGSCMAYARLDAERHGESQGKPPREGLPDRVDLTLPSAAAALAR